MITLNEIIRALTGQDYHEESRTFHHAVIDSRQAAEDVLFIAVPGEKTDGHKFLRSAFDHGAAAALIEEDVPGDFRIIDLRGGKLRVLQNDPDDAGKPLCIRVENTISALQKTAAFHRAQLPDMEVIGITGTVGKTTTKELIFDVLSEHFNTIKTPGNMNNEIGLPLTLLQTDRTTQQTILEMGFYVPGEIDQLCRIARPSVGVITNVGMVHASRAGSMEVIAKGKSELVQSLPPDGTAVLNYDDPYVRPMGEQTKAGVFYYGLDPSAALSASDVESRGLEGVYCNFVYQKEKHPIHIPLVGRHSVMTALRAAAVGLVKGLSWDEITERIEHSHNKLRMRITRSFMGGVLIDDTYNASPESTIAALNLLSEMKGRKVAVLGEMRELGQYEKKGHAMVGKRAAEVCDSLIAVGPVTKYIAEAAAENGMDPKNIRWFETTAEAADHLTENPYDSEWVMLVKGSRGMEMEFITNRLEEKK